MKTRPFSALRRLRTAAFTLIELLIVITIIAGLATMMIGIGRKLTLKAKSTLSLSQLKQIGSGIVGYTGDNNGRYPPSLYAASNVTSMEYINTYLDSSNFVTVDTPYGVATYTDPVAREDSLFLSPFRKADIDYTTPQGHPMCYTPNPLIMPEINPGSKAKRLHITRITRPGEIILYADTWTNQKGEGAVNFKGQPEMGSGPSNLNMKAAIINQSYGALHYEGDFLHALMADWSARTFKKDELLRRNLLFGPDETL